MVSGKTPLESDLVGLDDEDTYDAEDDVMPAEFLIIKKEVAMADGRTTVIEASITQNDESPNGISWIKMYEKALPSKFSHFYVDTMNPELILNALENYLERGKSRELVSFIQTEGKAVRDPVTFRLKLEAALGSVELGGDARALASGLF